MQLKKFYMRWLRPAALCCLSIAGSAQASNSLLIWPVNPSISSNERATALWLENRGSDVAHLQVRIVGWKQENNSNLYPEQGDIIGSPPIVKIEAGQRQLIRLTRIAPPNSQTEVAYRILVDEIPAQRDAQSSSSVSFQVRYSVPLFTGGPAKVSGGNNNGDTIQAINPSDLHIRVVHIDGTRALEIRNSGPRHVRLSDAAFVASGGSDSPVDTGLLGYVLPGATMTWPIAASARVSPSLRVKLNEAITPVQIPVVVQ